MVVLYGASLFVAGVETSLRNRPRLDVERIDAALPDARQRLNALRPDVIIFDSSDARLGTLPGMTQLLRENPGVPVIGLDLTSNEVTVLSSQQWSATTIEDLVAAIRMGMGRS
ncbi:MAG: hypothetical protein M5U01_37480 [Ardenticatenaceae bacterium]|nr:hypothetical protein [Ardenticatenaceae bacterium]